jgi:Fe-S cluster biogenesis protein NfuA
MRSGLVSRIGISSAAVRVDFSPKENMAQDTAFQKRIQRIGEMVDQLEKTTDPNARAIGRELLESLMALHGAALERMLEIAAEGGDSGETIIRKCGHDELVSSVLLLYALHPESMRTRVVRALEKIQPSLESHSANVELVSLLDDGSVTLRLHVKSSGCGSSASSVKSKLEAAIQNAAPDAASIVIEETDAAPTASGFVSLAQLENGHAMAALSLGRPQRSGD